MTRQVLNRCVVANDGQGDTPRTAALKINANFVELYKFLGDDSDVLAGKIQFDSDGIIFEGTSIDDFEVKLKAANATQDRILTLPDADGDFVLTTPAQTLTNKTLTSPVITTPQINDTSANHQYIFGVSELAADRTVTLPLLGNNDEFTFNNHTQTLTNKTLQSPLIINPRVGTVLADSAGNELIDFEPMTNAVNNIGISSASIGLHPAVKAVGGNGNINLELHAKGTGAVTVESKIAYGVQNVTTSSAVVDLNKPVTCFNMATAVTATMADGTEDGEVKYLINTGSGTVTVTVTNNNSARDVIELTQGETTHLVYSQSATEWFVISTTANIG